MKNEDYWERAALLRKLAAEENSALCAAQVIELYNEALKDIDIEIRKIKYNFQKRFGLDDETGTYLLDRAIREENLNSLIKLLENAPDEAARRDILEYIRRDGLSIRAYAARTERYNAVKTAIYTRIKKAAAEETGIIKNSLKDVYKESYYGFMDDYAKGFNVGISFAEIDDRVIEEAVSAPWHGKRFSRRVWDNTDKLAKTAQEAVVKSFMSGESWNVTAQKIADAFEVEKFRATTLVHTEAAHIHTKAEFKGYEELGIDEYKYLATLDYATCELCQPLDNRVFDRKSAREGVNCPVMHPRCRCTTTINMDYKNRRARNPADGRGYIVDGSMTYADWKNSLTPEQKKALEISRKKDSRKTADKLQFEQYKNVLGTKVTGKSFDKWQEMKYNDSEKYSFIKLDYKRQKHLINNPELALPNAKSVTADDRKFTNYLFGGENERGLAKGRGLTSRLGYDINNYADFKNEILEKAIKYPAKFKDNNGHGDKYEQNIVVYGLKGKPADILVGWLHDNKGIHITTIHLD